MAVVNYIVRVEDGTKTAPGVSFRQETDTGLYRIGANNLGLSVNDTKVMDYKAGVVALTGTLAVSGATTLSSTLAVTGNVDFTANTRMADGAAYAWDGTAEYFIADTTTSIIQAFTSGGTRMQISDTGVNVTGVLSSSGNADITGDLTVSGTGPHAIGGATLDRIQWLQKGAFTSGGSSNFAAAWNLDTDVTGASGDTTLLAQMYVTGSITTQTATETITDISSVVLNEPFITDNLTGDITNASTLKIVGAPTEGTNNYALWVDAGTTRLDGLFIQSTVTTLANDATPTVAAGNIFKTGGTTTITDFDDGVVGQTITILSAHAVTITDGAPIILNGSANFVMAAADTLTLTMFNDQVWQEVSRTVN